MPSSALVLKECITLVSSFYKINLLLMLFSKTSISFFCFILYSHTLCIQSKKICMHFIIYSLYKVKTWVWHNLQDEESYLFKLVFCLLSQIWRHCAFQNIDNFCWIHIDCNTICGIGHLTTSFTKIKILLNLVRLLIEILYICNKQLADLKMY